MRGLTRTVYAKESCADFAGLPRGLNEITWVRCLVQRRRSNIRSLFVIFGIQSKTLSQFTRPFLMVVKSVDGEPLNVLSRGWQDKSLALQRSV